MCNQADKINFSVYLHSDLSRWLKSPYKHQSALTRPLTVLDLLKQELNCRHEIDPRIHMKYRHLATVDWDEIITIDNF